MMGSMLEEASRWLADMREKHLAIRVHYVTCDGKVYSVKATVGRSEYMAPNEDGLIIKSHFRDFLITQLVLPRTPVFGDSIVWNDRIYEVLAPNGRDVWRWSDLFRTTKRIHTKYFKDAGGLYDETEEEVPEVPEVPPSDTRPSCPCCPCKQKG